MSPQRVAIYISHSHRANLRAGEKMCQYQLTATKTHIQCLVKGVYASRVTHVHYDIPIN